VKVQSKALNHKGKFILCGGSAPTPPEFTAFVSKADGEVEQQYIKPTTHHQLHKPHYPFRLLSSIPPH